MKNENIEIRTLSNESAEVRTIPGSRIVEGRAIVFNSESKDLGGFTEIITPEAIIGVLENSDVKATLNHDETRGVLARCIKGNGSLTLITYPSGVNFRFDAPKFPLGDELIEGIQRGDIVGSSFKFQLAPGGDKIEKRSDGSYLRTITKFSKIVDVSPCYDAAYNDTSVAIRNLDALKKIDDGTVEPPAKTGNENPVLELTKKQKHLKQLNDFYKH